MSHHRGVVLLAFRTPPKASPQPGVAPAAGWTQLDGGCRLFQGKETLGQEPVVRTIRKRASPRIIFS